MALQSTNAIGQAAVDQANKQAAAAQAKQLAADEAAYGTVYSDLNSDNFSGAFQAAEAATTGSYDNNELVRDLETSQGLEALDPGKQFSESEDAAFYKAALSNEGKLGQNAYGQWGDANKFASDASADYSTDAGADPNLTRFAGDVPTSFVDKWGLPLIGAALTIATAGAASEAGAAIGLSGLAATGLSAGVGAATGVFNDELTGSGTNLGAAAIEGGISGGLGGATNIGTNALEGAGLNSIEAGAISGAATHAAAGAIDAAVTGGSVAQGAELGAATGGVSGAISASPLKADITSATGSSIAGSATTGLIEGGLSKIAGSTLTSPSGQSATSTSSSSSYSSKNQFDASTELSPGVMPLTSGASTVAASPGAMSSIGSTNTDLAVGATPTSTAPSTSSSFLGSVGSGLASTLGGAGSSLGSDLGTLLPYAGVAAIGEAQAAAGQKEDAQFSQQQQAMAQPALQESAGLLNQYNSNTLNPTDQAVVDTGIKQGQTTIASANGLSAIAQTAFANYNSGTLTAGDQAALDANVAAQKSQVAQQLASAGITDSTILAAQNQNIDNQALISKQNTLNGYFNTGNSAYNSWLTATTEGQAAITQAQTFASTSLNSYLTNSMNEANIGMGEVNTAIQTQMTTDANYANQVSTLMGTLATAYAKQIAGQKASGTTGSSLLGSAAGSALKSGSSSGSSGTAGSAGATGTSTQFPNSDEAANPNAFTADPGTLDMPNLNIADDANDLGGDIDWGDDF